MRTIYLDSEFRCHITDDGTMTASETDFFDGKCQTFLEGYRLIPEGHSWTREDDVTFTGPMIAPWQDCRILEAAQAEYEQNAAQIAEMEEALNIYLTGGST